MVSTIQRPEQYEELRATITWNMRHLLLSDEPLARELLAQLPSARAAQDLQQLLRWYSWTPESGQREPQAPANPGCVALFEKAWTELDEGWAKLDDELTKKTPENKRTIFRQLFGVEQG